MPFFAPQRATCKSLSLSDLHKPRAAQREHEVYIFYSGRVLVRSQAATSGGRSGANVP